MWNIFIYKKTVIIISNYKLRRLAYKVLFISMLQRIIGVEPITQVTYVRNKNSLLMR